jgi:hypothetical protein
LKSFTDPEARSCPAASAPLHISFEHLHPILYAPQILEVTAAIAVHISRAGHSFPPQSNMKLLSWRLFGGGHVETPAHYAGVLIPLEDAHLYSHSARSGRTEYEEVPGDDGELGAAERPGNGHDDNHSGEAGKQSEHEGTGMLQMCAAEYSIEGLRREVRRGEKGQQWSAYESEFTSYPEFGPLVNSLTRYSYGSGLARPYCFMLLVAFTDHVDERPSDSAPFQ